MESFNELALNPLLLRAIKDMGFTKPSPIQAQTLPILLGESTDFIGLAATGTGKTAAFSLPLLEKIDPKKKGVQGLVLCPTRELAIQVAGQISLMGKAMGVKALPVYGGASFGDQMHGLKQGANVVVGTPGRLIDHLERKTLSLTDLVTIVLDEADEMISMGFKDELMAILAATNRETCNIWLFSATMNGDVRTVTNEYLKDPKSVQVNKKEMLSETVEQFYYPAQERDKPEILCKLIDMAENFYGLIFCQTKSLVMDLTQYLVDNGYKVDCLHGDKDQTARERTMNSFRTRKVNILVCTDVASRGLDVKDITHVINYSLPRELDNYVHRIGRTARSGKSGIAMSLVTPSHRVLLQRIERLTKSRMLEGKIPSRRDIAAKKVSTLLESFDNQNKFSRATELLDASWKESLSTMTTEEVAGRFLSILLPQLGGLDPRTDKATSKPLAQKPVQKMDLLTSIMAVVDPVPAPRMERGTERSSEREPGRERERHRSRNRYHERPRQESKPRMSNKDRFPKPEGPNRSERRKAKFTAPSSRA